MLKYKIVLALVLFSAFCNFSFSQKTKSPVSRDSFSRIELSFSIGYSRPLLEAYGEKASINATEDQILIDGKRLLVSDNLGTNTGFGVQTYLKYRFTKKGQLKGLFNLGYNNLFGTYPGPSGYDFGVRLQSFSAGLGAEINPIGHNSAVYPSVFGLMRLNFMGGESFHKAGLDFFKVSPRYGYSAGFKLNFKVKNTIDLFTGYSYSYDNAWNRQAAEEVIIDGHVIALRDEKSSSNGLSSDRRFAYWALYLGMNFFIK